jgi:membrane fusion protein, multidrug efflux system
VTLILENGSTFAPIGRLDFLDLSIDETTGTAALRAEFPNPGHQLLPGQFVRARIEAGQRPDGITVPQRAVRISPQGPSVMVIGAKSDAVARAVKLGDLQGGNWVITDGLKPGDRVIVDGLQKVMPGQPVRIAAPGKRPAAAPAR